MTKERLCGVWNDFWSKCWKKLNLQQKNTWHQRSIFPTNETKIHEQCKKFWFKAWPQFQKKWSKYSRNCPRGFGSMGGILTLEAGTHTLEFGVNRRVILPSLSPSSFMRKYLWWLCDDVHNDLFHPPHSCANIFGDFVDDDDHDDLSSSSSFSFANTFIGLKKILVNLKDTQGSRTLLASAIALQTEQTRRQRKVKQPTNKVWCVSHLRQCCHNNTLLLLHSHSQSPHNQTNAGKMPNSARSRISHASRLLRE